MTLRLSSCRYLLKEKTWGSAPGASDNLLKDADAARKGVESAKGTTREKLQQALRKLSLVEAQLEAAKGDQMDYPLSPGNNFVCLIVRNLMVICAYHYIYIYDNTYRYMQRYICTPLQSYISYIRIWSLFFMQSRKQATPQVVVIFSQVKSLWLQAQIFGRRQ